jgi:hypothetical protein
LGDKAMSKQKMKRLTKAQRKEVISQAIVRIKKGKDQYLCYAFSKSLANVLKLNFIPSNVGVIQRYIPEFKNSMARKYFGARRGSGWWDIETKDKKMRLKFLRYLLNNKLPRNKRKAKP